jgi:uncharacterized sulfatase
MLYEGGIRSPLIVWGPGVLPGDKQGTTDETAVISSIDLVPSLLSLAGVTAPADVQFDGEDIIGTLLGKESDGRLQPIFWRRPPDRPGERDTVWPDLAVRDGIWKLLIQFDGSGAQLYDLAADPGETKNLGKQRPEVVARLKNALLAWNAEMPPDAGPQFTTPKKKRPAANRR